MNLPLFNHLTDSTIEINYLSVYLYTNDFIVHEPTNPIYF